jgi:class 3 adenylate cyclase
MSERSVDAELSVGVSEPGRGATQEPAPARNLLTGEFVDAALERAYVSEQFRLYDCRFVRISMIVSAICFLSYAAHDVYVTPEVGSLAVRLRFGVFGPLGSLCVALAFSRWFERLHQQIAVLYGTSVAVTALMISSILPSESFYAYAIYASFYVTIGPFLLKLRVPAQLAFVAISLAAFNATVHFFPSDIPRVAFLVNFALSSLGALGAYIAWQQGMDARTSYLQRRLIAEQVDIIGDEREKADRLLLNILPAAIVERLKGGPEAIADGFAEVTVLFSDIVGFTKLSQRVTPTELVVRLNALFSAFDDAAVELGLEKIKTIGDAYMVVGGLPSPHQDHPGAIAEMALRMQAIVRQNAAEHGDDLDVRIGISTGPVVAGVIGKRKFVYDVWGDTVNTASRMESHSEPGRIQLTAMSHARLEQRFRMIPRGTIEVKGKGPMSTFFLEGRL